MGKKFVSITVVYATSDLDLQTVTLQIPNMGNQFFGDYYGLQLAEIAACKQQIESNLGEKVVITAILGDSSNASIVTRWNVDNYQITNIEG